MDYTSSLLLFLITITLSIFQTYSICMDFRDPMNFGESSTIVDCNLKPNDNVLDDLQLNDNDGDGNLFQVKLDCQANDPILCKKIEKYFRIAGETINYALVLNTPIIVDANYGPIDKINNDVVLGRAIPARFISLVDEDDGTERFYPQALVKQLHSVQQVSYADSDIIAQFNSLANWYFPDDDEGPMDKTQSDFSYTVLHELIHGLGFLTGWKNHLDRQLDMPTIGLTPFVATGSGSNTEPPDLPDGSFQFTGFYETIFDKFVIINNDKKDPLTTLANNLNLFPGKNQQFARLSDFYNQLTSSPLFDSAKEALTLSTLKDSLIFIPKGSTNIKDGLVLETSLKTYVSGSSISHADFNIFFGDSDFLMIFNSVPGMSMDSLITKSGNRTGSAIGPRLLGVLNSIGYNISNNPIKPNSSTPTISVSNKRSLILMTFQLILYIIINHFL